jgi:hypothetical protein
VGRQVGYAGCRRGKSMGDELTETVNRRIRRNDTRCKNYKAALCS